MHEANAAVTLPPIEPVAHIPVFNPALSAGFVTDPLAHWALATPDRPALIAPGMELSYAELEARTNQIAHTLIARGVGRGTRVAFVLNRGPQTILLLIGILKTGATYVPLDAASPLNRIKDCLEDAQPCLVVLEELRTLAEAALPCPLASLAEIIRDAESAPTARLSSELTEISGSDLAYIIFTSGTTGRPKGVPITHASLSNFVAGNQQVCIRVTAEDRVFQGFSPASDGHHEEVWPTFLAGGVLVVATGKEVYSGEDLGAFLNRHRVTIISCAPTLLSMVDADVPTLRRILFGAENCPAALVKRWWRPERQILNTYGPTEATVGATFSHCTPDAAITIGKPLPNYFCYVMDKNLDPVFDGKEGELCIAGIGVASGYFGRDDLSAAKFVPNPQALPGLCNETLYRTGDRARMEPDGNIVWLGRLDSQVKIRGHRIELSEIESRLAACPGVRSGVVVARESESGEASLAALIVVREDEPFDIAAVLDSLREALPGYMVPQTLEQVEQIPRLPSGKVDRRACQLLHGHVFRIEREIVPPRTEQEQFALAVWQELFSLSEISTTDDFFRDLGGSSLLASRFLSRLRTERRYSRVSVLDLYENPTLRSFASVLEGQTQDFCDAPPFHPVPPGRYRAAKCWQALGVLCLFGLRGFFWLGPILAAIYLSAELGHHDALALALGVVLHAASVPVHLLLVIALKWLIVGRFKPGSHPMWGGMYLRWWFVHRLLASAPVAHITGTPLAGLYLRLLGARVGRNVTLESLEMDCPDLIEIGDDCSFENSSWIHASEIAHGELHMRPVKLADGCSVGVRSGLSGGSAMEEGASLQDLTCITAGTTVPRGEEWGGSLARKSAQRSLPEYDPRRQPNRARLALFAAVQSLLAVVLALLDSLPFVTVAFFLYNWSEGFTAYLWEPVYAIALVLIAGIQVLAVKWAVLGKLKPGVYPFPGGYCLRKWFTDKHLELASGSIVPIYDSLFARLWCMALGMKCGPRCEIALPRRMPYDLVEMGSESFLASEVSIGRPIRRNGRLILERTVVGNRAFLGNDSVVPQGTHVPDEFLLGVLSVCPSDTQMGTADTQMGAAKGQKSAAEGQKSAAEGQKSAAKGQKSAAKGQKSAADAQAWLGSPAFKMPSRQVSEQFDSKHTYRPNFNLYVQRLAHETVRVFLPSLCSLLVASILIEGFVDIWNRTSLALALFSTPLLYLAGVCVAALICRISKALLIGVYRPTIQPLWSQFVWKTETHSAVLHDFAASLFITDIQGTPFLTGFLRLLGAKVGKRAFINTTDWTETDLIHLGDDVAINANAPLQAHLFEDRVMKVGAIKIGDRCSVGNYSVILCEAELKNDAHVGHLSLVMKGETIPSHSFWAGSPAQSGSVSPL
jgi:amino acid adenylation domain-containing protein